jgi:hypothetical protein
VESPASAARGRDPEEEMKAATREKKITNLETLGMKAIACALLLD